jgi:hypothetical protein
MREIDDVIKRFLSVSGDMVASEIASEAPVRAGRLRGDITIFDENINNGVVEVGNSSYIDYAKYLYFGTKPYVITPKSKKALYWKGARNPSKKVNHPGIKADKYLDRGFENAFPKIEKLSERMGIESGDIILKKLSDNLKSKL